MKIRQRWKIGFPAAHTQGSGGPPERQRCGKPLSLPPLPCWQQRPVVLCRSSAPLQREVKESSTVFFSSPSSWKNMERISRSEESFWPPGRALWGFVCSAWCCTLCSGGQGVGTCQIQAVPQSLLLLIPWLNSTHSTQVDAWGQNKVLQTLESAGNPNPWSQLTGMHWGGPGWQIYPVGFIFCVLEFSKLF